MAYNADLDPNNFATATADADTAAWDFAVPDWRELSGDPERFVSEADYFAQRD